MNTETNTAGASGSAGAGPSRSADDIASDIDATREELDRTLDALHSKLSPKERIASAAGSVREYGTRLLGAAGNTLSPDITTMIRMDHTHALAVFRRFRPGISTARKRALATNLCLALEIHAQLEEEIFYPALQQAAGISEVLGKSVPEHDEMRALIGKLRSLDPDHADFDQTVHALMRIVLHHVADEESILLPQAEEVMSDRLGQLGIQMTKRRLELLGPHVGEVAASTVRSFPLGVAALAAGVLMLAWLVIRPRRVGV